MMAEMKGWEWFYCNGEAWWCKWSHVLNKYVHIDIQIVDETENEEEK